jgi:hypothetical protein
VVLSDFGQESYSGLDILPALNLTPTTRSGLSLVRDMPDGTLNLLLVELERSPDSIPSLPGLSPGDAELVKESLDAMYAVRAYHDVELEEFVGDISDAFKFNKELPPEKEPDFRQRLLRILDIAPLRVTAKAILLHGEYERDFCTARILTDIRPIYDNGVKGPPSGAIIMHTLKLTYHEGASGELSEMYLAMGSDDIVELQRVLMRAIDKVTGLRGVLEAGKIRYIDPQR